ncbi:unnamed protein product [Citrullus colocynthis]|uniref:TIR domain-containing protein n=1 Tax=Citrullus colocynthis TaxID=252529 RepID=A0ABP0Y2X1_9ROSI
MEVMSHDVFISFKPEDSDCFVRFLYEELCGLGMVGFEYDGKDMEEDMEDPTETLVKGIEGSRSSIVVLSQNYASSHWCLKELTKIIDRMDRDDDTANNNHPVLPVFYEVDPLDVQTLSGSFKRCFDEHEREIAQDLHLEQYSREVQIWKTSIKRIGTMSGIVVIKHSDEVNVIKIIAMEMFDRLGRNFVVPNKYKSLLEMWPRLDKMIKLLDLESNEVRLVGVVGMGGIGKTTIAEVVYDKLSAEFLNNRCFLRIDHNKSLMSLQHQLLSEFLSEKERIKIENEDDGMEMIKNHLSKRKVLIVVDGVNEKTQLEKLVGSPDWFGAKSRVIITTRNRDILRQQHNYEGKMVEYNVSLLSNDGAMELFCKHAFQGGRGPPDENFEHLTEEMVEKVKGNPLALKKIGSYLYGQSEDRWKEALKDDENLVNENLFIEILKMSYEELDGES